MESASSIYNLGVQYAMTLMSIIPLLIIYLVVQKGFVAGIDKSGIAGQ
jgi:ABC-type glycerol-3-phosphate transport system permease component